MPASLAPALPSGTPANRHSSNADGRVAGGRGLVVPAAAARAGRLAAGRLVTGRVATGRVVAARAGLVAGCVAAGAAGFLRGLIIRPRCMLSQDTTLRGAMAM